MTKKEFLDKTTEKYGDLFEYNIGETELDDFLRLVDKIQITCKKHGSFIQNIRGHLNTNGCKGCHNESMENIFLERFKISHGEEYDYSLMEYNGINTKIKIICKKHGIFEKEPRTHIVSGCPHCYSKIPLTNETFIEKANEIHNHKYDYSLLEFKNSKNPIIIICPIHGKFTQMPYNHLSQKGCAKCAGNISYTTEVFKEKAIEIHGDKYNYSLVEYKNNKEKVKIICPEHGIFEQTIKTHIVIQIGCPYCSNKIFDTFSFIKKAKELHGDKYDYSLVEYKNCEEKVKIICPEHGIFEQSPSNHTHVLKYGCKKCTHSNGENLIKQYFLDKHILFEEQKTFDGCVHTNKLRFDFYLNDYNICVEYDGIQHYKKIEFFGGEKRFKDTQEKDKIKYNFCLEHKIRLIRIKYNYDTNKVIHTLNNIFDQIFL